VGQGVEGQGDIGIKGLGLPAHKQVDNIAEQFGVLIGKLLQRALAAAGKQSLPVNSAFELPKGDPLAGYLPVGFVSYVGEQGSLNPGDDMAFRAQLPLLVEKKILAHGVDGQLIVSAGRTDLRRDFRKVDGADFFFQPIDKLGLIRFEFCTRLRVAGKLLLLFYTDFRVAFSTNI